jgi:hypothetical protein
VAFVGFDNPCARALAFFSRYGILHVNASTWSAEMNANAPTPVKYHVLPGENGGDSGWRSRQSSFEQQVTVRQVAFKRRRWPHLPDGRATRHPTFAYPHVLPARSVLRLLVPTLYISQTPDGDRPNLAKEEQHNV